MAEKTLDELIQELRRVEADYKPLKQEHQHRVTAVLHALKAFRQVIGEDILAAKELSRDPDRAEAERWLIDPKDHSNYPKWKRDLHDRARNSFNAWLYTLMQDGRTVNTGVHARIQDIEEARRRSREVSDTPVMKVHGQWVNETASESFKKWLDDLAVKYGLPPPTTIDGEVNHYGMSPEGEFTRYEAS